MRSFALVPVPAADEMTCDDQCARRQIELAGRVYRNKRGHLAVLELRGDLDVCADQQHLRHMLAEAMVSCLRPRHRMVIVRRYFEGSTLDEVAKELDVSITAVARIEQRALATMSRSENLLEFVNGRRTTKEK